MRVCVVGDLHATKGQDLTRVDHIASHIEETKPNVVLLMGDQGTWDSVSRHAEPGSHTAREAPTIEDDFAVTREVLERLDGLPNDIKLVALMGNHEQRLKIYEDADQRLRGSLWPRLKSLYEAYGWEFSEYGVYYDLGGVKATHAPLNGGRGPYGNWTTLARDLTFDLIWAHTHKFQFMSFPKIEGGISILNPGCALPQDHVEEYAKLSPTNWWWGIVDVEINDGKIGGYSRFSMRELQKRYA